MKHEVFERRLASGARFFVVNVPQSPIFEMETIVDSGHRFAKPGQYELPHLLEHLALEGSKRFPDPQDFQYEIERYGIYHNAWTSIYKNGYVFYGAMEYWEHIADLSMEQLLHPIFQPEAIKQQTEVVINELTGRMNNARGRAGWQLYRLEKNGQVPDWPERIASLESITRSDITAFYKRYYHPSNFIHVVTGDLPEERVDELVKMLEVSQAGRIKRKVDGNPAIIPDKPKSSVMLLDYPFEETVSFSMHIFRPGFDEAKFEPMQLFATMLSGGSYSRIHQKVRHAGLGYSVGANFNGDSEKGVISIWDESRSKHFIPLLRLVLGEVEDLARGNFTDRELERARGYSLGRQATRFQTALSITSWYSGAYIDDLPLISPDETAEILRNVTREQIIEAAQYYCAKDDAYRYLVASTQHGGQKELEKLVADFGV